MAEVCRLEERVHAAEKGSKSLCVERALADKLMTERASYASGTEPAKAKRETLAARTCEFEAAAASCHGELGVVVRRVQSLKGRFAVHEDRANTAEARAHGTLDEMTELRALINGLNPPLGA